MNLDPSIWGPHYWATLHFIASTYDNNPNLSIRTTMKTFIKTLPVLLPCKECQDHAFNFIKTATLDKVVASRKELFTFFFNFHNSVNQRLKKPLMTLKDALKMYHVPKEEHAIYLWNYVPSTSNYILYLTVTIILIIVLIYLSR